MQQDQFDQQMEYNNKTLQQNQTQFDQTMQFNRDQMSQQNQQFLAQLNQQDKQFYAQLDANQQAQLASIAASQGAAAASSSLAERKFAYEQGMDWLTYQTQQQALTTKQMEAASSAGGFIPNAIAAISNKTANVASVRAQLDGMGYTKAATESIMQQIMADAGVKAASGLSGSTSLGGNVSDIAAIGTGYTPTGTGSTSSNTTYTPTAPAGFDPIEWQRILNESTVGGY
jgi:hypothetical protein